MIGSIDKFLECDWWHIMESPKGPFTAYFPFWPQQVKAGSLQAMVLVIAHACLEEGREFLFIQCCVGTHFTDEKSGPREVKQVAQDHTARKRQSAPLSQPHSLQILHWVSIWPSFLREDFCLNKNFYVACNS